MALFKAGEDFSQHLLLLLSAAFQVLKTSNTTFVLISVYLIIRIFSVVIILF